MQKVSGKFYEISRADYCHLYPCNRGGGGGQIQQDDQNILDDVKQDFAGSQWSLIALSGSSCSQCVHQLRIMSGWRTEIEVTSGLRA